MKFHQEPIRRSVGKSTLPQVKPASRRRTWSFWGGFGQAPSSGDADKQLEMVRTMMLLYLDSGKLTQRSLFRRIQYAGDIEVLWYLRSDMMVELSATHGESIARLEMKNITDAFQQALPKAMRSRVAPRHG